MGRWLVWAVIAAAAAGAAFLFLGGHADETGECGDLGPGATQDPRAVEGPRLEGAAVETRAVEAAVPGRFRVRGRVVDEKGAPLASTRVGMKRMTTRVWDPLDARTWGQDPSEAFRKTVSDMDLPAGTQTEPEEEVVSGADGTFELRPSASGSLYVWALVDPPRASTRASATVTSTQPEATATVRVSTATSTLHGRVVDGSDRPLAGVAVSGSQWVDGQGSWTAPSVATGADGGFALEGLVAGKWTLGVRVPGRLRVNGVTVELPREDVFTIRIEGGGVVRGSITDLAGKPVPEAVLMLTVTGDGATKTTATVRVAGTAAGEYRAEGVPPGKVTEVTAEAPGYAVHRSAPPLATWSGAQVSATSETTVDVVLETGGSVEGRVVEAGTGKGIPGAEVLVLLPQQRTGGGSTSYPAPVVTRSGSDGAFRVTGVPTGKNLLVARAAGYYLRQLEGLPTNLPMTVDGRQAAPGAPPELLVLVPPEGASLRRDVVLTPGLAVSGRVVDSDGAPVEGAEIRPREYGIGRVAWQWGVSWNGQEVLGKSGADGRFEAKGLPPRDAWVLFARKAPYTGVTCEPFALAAGAPSPEVTLRLERGAVVAGRVIGADGQPLSGARANVWNQRWELSGGRTDAETDASGAFRIEGVSPGTSTLNVSAPKVGTKSIPLEGLKPGEVREGIEVRLELGVVVSGTLVDADGRPVSRRQMTIQRESGGGSNANTMSAEDGTFTFTNAPTGRCRVSVMEEQDGSWTSVSAGDAFESPASGLRIVVAAGAKQTIVEGTVLDAKGAPVPLVSVVVAAANRQESSRGYGGGMTNDVVGGKFRRVVKGDPPFVVTASGARDADGRPMNLRSKTETVEDPAKPVEVRLEEGVEVAGRVVDARDEGVANAYVRAGSVTTVSAEDGRFRLRGLVEDEVEVAVTPPAKYVVPAAVKIRAGATDCVVVLRSAAAIAGSVVDPDGQQVSGGWVQAQWPSTRDAAAGSANAQLEAGRFRITGLPQDAVATVTVQVWTGSGTQFPPVKLTDVRAGTTDIVVRLEAGVSIEGTVVDADGKPYTSGYVLARGEGGNAQSPQWAQIQPDGSFKATGLKPGSYALSVQRSDTGQIAATATSGAPASGVRIQLARAEKVTGRLVGGGDLGQWQITLWVEKGMGSSGGNSMTNADGSFEIAGVAGGPYLLFARKEGDDRYGLVAGIAAGARDVAVTLERGDSIEGTVEASNGGGLKDAWIVVNAGSWQTWARGDADGRFRARGLPSGRYKLLVYAANVNFEHPEEVPTGTTNLRLRPR